MMTRDNRGLSRREFVRGGILCGATALLGIPRSSWASGGLGFAERAVPFISTTGLLGRRSDEIVPYLKQLSFVFDESEKRFYRDDYEIYGYKGTAALTILGNQTSETGRRMDPDRLEGEAPCAVQYTVIFKQGQKGRLVGEDVQKLLEHACWCEGIDEDDVIGEIVAPSVEEVPPISQAAARCAVNEKDALWAAYVSDGAGITLSCSYLDYYLLSTSWFRNLGEKYEAGDVDAVYEAIADTPTWDISIDDTIEGPIARADDL